MTTWLDAVAARDALGDPGYDTMATAAAIRREDRRHLLRLVGQLRAAVRNYKQEHAYEHAASRTIDGVCLCVCLCCVAADEAIAACEAATPPEEQP